jgi:hypothetical protein
MDNKLTHEKYVSIDYDLWENHYKLLEERNKILTQQLEEEIEKKKLTITLSLHRHYRDYKYQEQIGTINMDMAGSYEVLMDYDRERVFRNIQSDLLSVPRGHFEKITLLTTDDLKTWEFKNEEEQKVKLEILTKREGKIEHLIQQNYEKYKKIPTFVRWLFGIKANIQP